MSTADAIVTPRVLFDVTGILDRDIQDNVIPFFVKCFAYDDLLDHTEESTVNHPRSYSRIAESQQYFSGLREA
jgi:hypothetical protein